MAKRKRKVYPGSLYVPKGRTQIRAKIKNDDYKPGIDPPGREFKTVATGFPDTTQGWAHAEAWLERVHLQRRGLLLPTSSEKKDLTFEAIWAEYERIRCRKLHPSTKRNYQLSWDTFVVDSEQLCTHENILACVREYAATHTVSTASFNTYLTKFQVILNWAHRNKFLAHKIDMQEFFYDVEPTPNLKYEVDEYINLYIYFWKRDKEFAIMLEVMWYTGARIGDLLSLTWEQINWNNETIDWQNKRSKKSEIVVVARRVLQALSLIERKGKSKLKVFRWSPKTHSILSKKLYKGMEAMGIPRNDRSFHEFRKTFCNTIFDPTKPTSDLPLNLKLKIVRHKTVDVTIKSYLETDMDRMSDIMNKL